MDKNKIIEKIINGEFITHDELNYVGSWEDGYRVMETPYDENLEKTLNQQGIKTNVLVGGSYYESLIIKYKLNPKQPIRVYKKPHSDIDFYINGVWSWHYKWQEGQPTCYRCGNIELKWWGNEGKFWAFFVDGVFRDSPKYILPTEPDYLVFYPVLEDDQNEK